MRTQQLCSRLEVYLTAYIALELLYIEHLGCQILHTLVIPCSVVKVTMSEAALTIMHLWIITRMEFTITHQHVVIDILRRLTVVSLCQRHAVSIGVRTAVGEQGGSREVEETATLATSTLSYTHHSRLVDETWGMVARRQRDVGELHRHKAWVISIKATQIALSVILISIRVTGSSSVLC